MKGLVREYSVAAILIVVGIVAYLYYWNNREAILDYSLDAVGDRLVAMVDDVSGRHLIAEHFERFKQRVLAREVAPEEVENVAANVFNLSNSGSKLTPEQADMVLQFAVAAPEAVMLPQPALPGGEETPEARPATPTPPATPTRSAASVEPEALNTLAERLNAMLALNEEVQALAEERTALRQKMARVIHFRFDHGLHATIDSSLAADLPHPEFNRLAREVRKLEKKKLVIWKKDMADEMRAKRDRARHEADAVVAMTVEFPEAAVAALSQLESLASLKELEEMGYSPRFDVDSLRQVIRVQMEAAMRGATEARREAVEGVRARSSGGTRGEGRASARTRAPVQ